MALKRNIAEGEYYHLYNRGTHKANIFKDDIDRRRFLFSILYFQSPIPFTNLSRYIEKYSSLTGFPVPEPMLATILESRIVELTSFCLMPNHFHLLVREIVPGGISLYMQRILTAHTMYMNTRHQLSGHIFEGRFKHVLVKDNAQLLYLSAYIHRNPRELTAWKGKEFSYPWSSLQDFTEANRWGGLLETDIIAEQFETTSNSNYKDFVETSTAKILEEELKEGLTKNIFLDS